MATAQRTRPRTLFDLQRRAAWYVKSALVGRVSAVQRAIIFYASLTRVADFRSFVQELRKVLRELLSIITGP